MKYYDYGENNGNYYAITTTSYYTTILLYHYTAVATATSILRVIKTARSLLVIDWQMWTDFNNLGPGKGQALRRLLLLLLGYC